jgi:hypothetical protein
MAGEYRRLLAIRAAISERSRRWPMRRAVAELPVRFGPATAPAVWCWAAGQISSPRPLLGAAPAPIERA